MSVGFRVYDEPLEPGAGSNNLSHSHRLTLAFKMPPKFLYRVFHDVHSAGINSRDGFRSGLQEFENSRSDKITLGHHSNHLNRNPTPWISTTDEILRAIQRAIVLAGANGIAGVHIAVIAVAICESNPPRKASKLRFDNGLGYDDPWHKREFLIQWEIPRSAIVSSLSFQILRDRGF